MRNKLAGIMAYITDENLDLVFIQETWLRKSDGHLLTEIREYGYEVITYRKTRRLDFGGGVALIYKNGLKIRNVKNKNFSSFEHIECQLITENGPVKFLNIYRPPYSKKNRCTIKKFFEEFSDLLINNVASSSLPYFLVGDYNIHVELSGGEIFPGTTVAIAKNIKEATEFTKILHDNNITQLIDNETHILHGTLDLLMTQTENIHFTRNVRIGHKNEICESDHFPVTFSLQLKPMYKDTKVTISKRNFNDFNSVLFVEEIENELPIERLLGCDVNSCAKLYDESLRAALDRQCPIVTKTIRSRPRQKWFDTNLKNLKQRKRAAERKWKKYPSQESLNQLNIIKQEYKNTISDTRTAFIRTNLDQNKNDQRKLHKSVNYLTGSVQEKILPSYTSKLDLANEMTKFYYNKVQNIRREIQTQTIDYTPADPEECTSIFTDFQSINNENLKNIIFSMSKGHPHDPIPVWLLKQCYDQLSPILLQIINKSLQECTFPDSLKHAVITPIIKDKDGDVESFKNYRPVSNLTFLSKLIEKCASLQLHKYLSENDLYPTCQSAYRKNHSCESALLKVVNDIQSEIANKKMVALITLDLSSAFDTIDHDLLLHKLEKDFGISGNALFWLKSYLSDRTFAVRIIDVEGQPVWLIFGVPQGSILGPLLFILYIHDMAKIAEKYGLNVHFYADDSELYIGFSPLTEASQSMLLVKACLNEIKGWMHTNFLKINMDKTNVMFFGRYQELNLFTVDITIEGKFFENNINSTLETLGIILDSKLSMQAMVSESCKSCYFQLKKLQSIRRCLNVTEKTSLVHANILSRLDYGNVLLVGSSVSLIKRLQKVLNATVRFIYNLRKSQSVTNFTKKCHFLPVKYRIMFKSCLVVYKILNNLAPEYLKEMAVPVTRNRENMRSSADNLQLKYPDSEKCIQYQLVKNWNILPFEIRKSPTIEHFKTSLKTYYFTKAYD